MLLERSHRGRHRRGLRHRARDRDRLRARGRAGRRARHEWRCRGRDLQQILNAGGKAQAFTLDVTDREACRVMATKVAGEVGNISILVNNAGINRRNAFTSEPSAVTKDWDDIIGDQSQWRVQRDARLPRAAARQQGPHRQYRLDPVVRARAHAELARLHHLQAWRARLHRALAAELGKDGVRVNAIGPGLIETPLNAAVRANNPELIKIFMDHTPLGRAGKPEDIVGPAVFLASDLSSYVTGTIVMADGGYRSI